MRPIDEQAIAENYLNTSDGALIVLLDRIKAAVDPIEIRELSDQIERVIFHQTLLGA